MKQLSDYNIEYAEEATREIVKTFQKIHTFTGIEKQYLNSIITKAINRGMVKAVQVSTRVSLDTINKTFKQDG